MRCIRTNLNFSYLPEKDDIYIVVVRGMTANRSHVERGSMHIVKHHMIYSPERNITIIR
jgi:hypothetical protein